MARELCPLLVARVSGAAATTGKAEVAKPFHKPWTQATTAKSVAAAHLQATQANSIERVHEAVVTSRTYGRIVSGLVVGHNVAGKAVLCTPVYHSTRSTPVTRRV